MVFLVLMFQYFKPVFIRVARKTSPLSAGMDSADGAAVLAAWRFFLFFSYNKLYL